MLTIIKMNEENVEQAAQVAAQCLREAWSVETCRKQLTNPNDTTLVAFEADKAVGFLSCWCIAGEAEINNVCVLPDHRRKGIAKAMFDKLAELLPDAQSWVLEVRESNTAAIALYESLGFSPAGVRRDFYEAPTENAVIMVK